MIYVSVGTMGLWDASLVILRNNTALKLTVWSFNMVQSCNHIEARSLCNRCWAMAFAFTLPQFCVCRKDRNTMPLSFNPFIISS